MPTLGGPAMTIVKPVAQALRRVRGRERPVDPLERGARRASHGFKREILRVLDVGEIDLRLDRRHGLEQPCTDCLALTGEAPARHALGLPPLRLRFRLDQIGEPFHFGKIDLALHEGAPGEFAGLGEPQPGNKHERLDDRRHDRAPAGDADFRHLLAGEAARRLKTGDQRPVQRLAGLRVAQDSQHSVAVGKLGSRRNCLKRGGAARPGQAHNRDRGPAGSGRGREDGVLVVCEQSRLRSNVLSN